MHARPGGVEGRCHGGWMVVRCDLLTSEQATDHARTLMVSVSVSDPPTHQPRVHVTRNSLAVSCCQYPIVIGGDYRAKQQQCTGRRPFLPNFTTPLALVLRRACSLLGLGASATAVPVLSVASPRPHFPEKGRKRHGNQRVYTRWSKNQMKRQHARVAPPVLIIRVSHPSLPS